MQHESTPQVVVDLERLRVINCGLGRFALHLGTALLDEAPEDLGISLLVPPGSNHFADDGTRRQYSVRRWHGWPPLALAPLRMRARLGLPRGDLWHVTNQDSRCWPVGRRTPVLLTIHDLNFLREKSPRQHMRRVGRLQRLVDRAAGVSTISEFSAGEIRAHLRLRDKPLRVIHNGLSAPRLPETRPVDSVPPGRFLFTIGDITAKKNFHVLFDLMALLPEYQLVVAGRKRSAYSRFLDREVARRGMERKVILPGEVSDAQRQWLYQRCDAFLFPSLAEGFGLPVIEAMSFGKPVFITRGTSLPEVGGELANYWEDFEPENMLRGLRAGLERAGRDPDFAAKSRLHAARFSWTRAAREYIAYYRELLGMSGTLMSRAA